MNTKDKILLAGGIILGIGLISVTPKTGLTSSTSEASLIDVSPEIVMTHMTEVVCKELKEGVDFRRAGFRAGKSAKKKFNASKQFLEVVNQDSFDEDFFIAISDACPAAVEEAMLKATGI